MKVYKLLEKKCRGLAPYGNSYKKDVVSLANIILRRKSRGLASIEKLHKKQM